MDFANNQPSSSSSSSKTNYRNCVTSDEECWATRSSADEYTAAAVTGAGRVSHRPDCRRNKKKYHRQRELLRRPRFIRSKSFADFKCLTYAKDEVKATTTMNAANEYDSVISENNNTKSSEIPSSSFRSYDRRQKLIILCLALINFGSYLSMSIIAPFFPIEAELKGMSLSVTGYVFSVYALIMFVVSPIIGKLIPFVGVKFTFISGIFLAAGCNILFGALNYVNNTAVFTSLCFLLRGFEAVGSASFFTAACTIVAENFRDDVGTAYGLMETFMGIGMTAGPAIGSALYSLGGYELPFYTLGSFLMITVPISMVILPDSPTDAQDEGNSSSSDSSLTPATFWQLLKLPEIIITSFIAMVLCGIWGFLDPILEPHLREFGVTPQTIGLIFLAMAGTYSITCPIVGKIVDKWGFEVVMMAFGLIMTAFCLFLMGPAILFPFFPRNLVTNIVGLVLMGITIGVGFIPTLQNMLESSYLRGFEENTATYSLVSSIFTAATSFGEFLGPAVGGIMFEKYGFDFASTVIAFVAILIAAVLIVHRGFCRNKLKDKTSTPSSISVEDDGAYTCTETTPLLSRNRSFSTSV